MPRKIPSDWHDGELPDNVLIHESAYIATSATFELFDSQMPQGVRLDSAASAYHPTVFDVGPRGQVHVGEYAMLNGPRIICDESIDIGAYCLISWNVVL